MSCHAKQALTDNGRRAGPPDKQPAHTMLSDSYWWREHKNSDGCSIENCCNRRIHVRLDDDECDFSRLTMYTAGWRCLKNYVTVGFAHLTLSRNHTSIYTEIIKIGETIYSDELLKSALA